MILRIIHPLFKLDLTYSGLTLVEENSWFNDRFFVKYSYPFTFDLTDELDIALGMISKINRAGTRSVFDVKFMVEGRVQDALFVVESITGRKASGKVSYGLEELPNWDKKLSALPLEDFELDSDIYAFAKANVGNTWPNENFCFPQVFAPDGSFSTDDDKWAFFEGALNNYNGSAFLSNEYDTGTDQQVNRNIVQPMPFLLYILKTGFADAGLELKGDILEDPELSIAFMATVSNYYTTAEIDSKEVFVKSDDYETISVISGVLFRDIQNGVYNTTKTLTEPGRYKIAGNVTLRAIDQKATAYIKFGDRVVWSSDLRSLDYKEGFRNVDINIDVFNADAPKDLLFHSFQLSYGFSGDTKLYDGTVFDMTLTKLSGYDQNDVAQPTLIAPQAIKLSRCVPDKTFGELFTAIRNFRNYDLSIEDGKAIVNRTDRQLYDLPKVSVKDYEIREPEISTNQDKAFLLKFEEVDHELFDNSPVYVDRNGSSTQGFDKLPETTEITINLAPLPKTTKKGKTTAQMISEDNSKIQLGLYSGNTTGNTTDDPAGLSLLSSFENFYRKWFYFRLNTATVKWAFLCTPELARTITAYTELQAYSSRFVPERVSKDVISRDLVKITLEVDKLVKEPEL